MKRPDFFFFKKNGNCRDVSSTQSQPQIPHLGEIKQRSHFFFSEAIFKKQAISEMHGPHHRATHGPYKPQSWVGDLVRQCLLWWMGQQVGEIPIALLCDSKDRGPVPEQI